MAKQSLHFAIVGRIPDGESVSFVCSSPSRTSALKSFEAHLYTDEARGTKARTLREHGTAKFVDAVFVSATPMFSK